MRKGYFVIAILFLGGCSQKSVLPHTYPNKENMVFHECRFPIRLNTDLFQLTIHKGKVEKSDSIELRFCYQNKTLLNQYDWDVIRFQESGTLLSEYPDVTIAMEELQRLVEIKPNRKMKWKYHYSPNLEYVDLSLAIVPDLEKLKKNYQVDSIVPTNGNSHYLYLNDNDLNNLPVAFLFVKNIALHSNAQKINYYIEYLLYE
jgi:hypothetical protein